MDDAKYTTAIWISGFMTLLVAIFIVAGCVREDNQRDANLRMTCIKLGGEWAYATGSTTTYTCRR